MLDVVEYLDEHFILADPLRDTIGVVVSAVVDDAIHVQVEAVELGDAVLGDELRDRGIALREPAEEFRDTYVSLVMVEGVLLFHGCLTHSGCCISRQAEVGVGGVFVV
jgi:hypothetical protein